ncbi:hypothetical protein [Helicobacter typhlonius]|uniref:hypothetical protein n=1 Tax=Helicobacter typhlonius TaxID=76936 RepID=UPI002FE42A92
MKDNRARCGCFDAVGIEFRDGDKVKGLYGEDIVKHIPQEYDYRIECNGVLYFLDSSWQILKEVQNEQG